VPAIAVPPFPATPNDRRPLHGTPNRPIGWSASALPVRACPVLQFAAMLDYYW